MDDATIKTLGAMACITAIELYAIHTGMDGTVLAAVIGALAGLGGYAIGHVTKE